jgi:hypothetical protein
MISMGNLISAEDWPTELVSDDPPKSGTWVETCEILESPSEFEAEAGRVDGETVDYEGSEEEPLDE